jgi:hypothetical protein
MVNAEQGAGCGQFEQQAIVGAAGNPGFCAYDAERQSYTIRDPGSAGGQDAWQFVYRHMSGDFIVTAQVGPAGELPPGQCGWMARSGLEPEAAYVAAVIGADGRPTLQFRRAGDGATEQVQAVASGADIVQLERKGRTYVMSFARFGEPFSTLQVTDVELADKALVGLFAGAQVGAGGGAAAFHNVRIVAPAAAGFNRQTDPFGSRLELLEIATGRRQIVYSTDQVIEAPNWTRDDKALIYNSGGRLYRFALAQKTHELIDTGNAVRNNNDHVISFDGTQLAISSHDERGDSRVHILPLTGGQPRRVTPVGHSFLHGWSPDGKYLVYTGYRNGVFDIYRIAVEGGEEERLTTSPGLDDGPEYTPDGKYIYFNSTRSGRMQLWRMKADGSEQEQLTDDDCDNWFPHISPDGHSIVFLSYLPGEVEPHDHPPARRVYLRLMPLEGGAPQVIAYLYGGQGTINVPSWSPDGKRIAFVSNTVPYK